MRDFPKDISDEIEFQFFLKSNTEKKNKEDADYFGVTHTTNVEQASSTINHANYHFVNLVGSRALSPTDRISCLPN